MTQTSPNERPAGTSLMRRFRTRIPALSGPGAATLDAARSVLRPQAPRVSKSVGLPIRVATRG